MNLLVKEWQNIGSHAHIWEANDEWYWDDAEDHRGFDRNVPCGPFASQDLAEQDARDCFRSEVTFVEGKPARYGIYC